MKGQAIVDFVVVLTPLKEEEAPRFIYFWEKIARHLW